VTGMLPSWDGAGTVNRLLPEWALALTRSCGDRYAFSTMQVWEGRAVVAVKTGDGAGPLLIITRNEDEMRQALGLKSSPPPS
jgi:hypothetical protein